MIEPVPEGRDGERFERPPDRDPLVVELHRDRDGDQPGDRDEEPDQRGALRDRGARSSRGSAERGDAEGDQRQPNGEHAQGARADHVEIDVTEREKVEGSGRRGGAPGPRAVAQGAWGQRGERGQEDHRGHQRAELERGEGPQRAPGDPEPVDERGDGDGSAHPARRSEARAREQRQEREDQRRAVEHPDLDRARLTEHEQRAEDQREEPARVNDEPSPPPDRAERADELDPDSHPDERAEIDRRGRLLGRSDVRRLRYAQADGEEHRGSDRRRAEVLVAGQTGEPSERDRAGDEPRPGSDVTRGGERERADEEERQTGDHRGDVRGRRRLARAADLGGDPEDGEDGGRERGEPPRRDHVRSSVPDRPTEERARGGDGGDGGDDRAAMARADPRGGDAQQDELHRGRPELGPEIGAERERDREQEREDHADAPGDSPEQMLARFCVASTPLSALREAGEGGERDGEDRDDRDAEDEARLIEAADQPRVLIRCGCDEAYQRHPRPATFVGDPEHRAVEQEEVAEEGDRAVRSGGEREGRGEAAEEAERGDRGSVTDDRERHARRGHDREQDRADPCRVERVDRGAGPERDVEDPDPRAGEPVRQDAVSRAQPTLGAADERQAEERPRDHARGRFDPAVLDAVLEEVHPRDDEDDRAQRRGAAHADPLFPADGLFGLAVLGLGSRCGERGLGLRGGFGLGIREGSVRLGHCRDSRFGGATARVGGSGGPSSSAGAEAGSSAFIGVLSRGTRAPISCRPAVSGGVGVAPASSTIVRV